MVKAAESFALSDYHNGVLTGARLLQEIAADPATLAGQQA